MKRVLPTVLLVLTLHGCGSPTSSELEPEACAQTFEFANYGCAHVVVQLGNLPDDLPGAVRWKVSADAQRADAFDADRGPVPEAVSLRVILRTPLPNEVDTTTALLTAEVRDDSGPVDLGAPLPLVASDTVSYLLRFAGVGERPRVDTLRLSLERVDGP